MLFNSLQFLWFLPVVVLLYYLAPRRARWAILLGASYYFYACWRLDYLALILASTVVDYSIARGMARWTERPATRRLLLVLSLTLNLGLLFFFKYLDFFGNSAQQALNVFGFPFHWELWDLLLPVGISFYTFQTLSYTVDVYRGERPPERHFGYFALYVSFFPQLVAGPIERSTRLLPMLRAPQTLSEARFQEGAYRCLWGLFKKIAVADTLAQVVNQIYADPSSQSSLALLVATYFFAFQIYCDFSGYSDIAVGAAKMLGVDLMENFQSPYFASSLTDFWRRWHISLSTWFRDYVYIPLGGSRGGTAQACFNVLVVFVLSGLWHGANWTFVAWGLLHGAVLVIEKLTGWARVGKAEATSSPALGNLGRLGRVLLTFHVVVLGWVFFRSPTLSEALSVFVQLSSGTGSGLPDPYFVMRGTFLIVFLMAVEFATPRYSLIERMQSWPLGARWVWTYVVLLLLLVFGTFSGQEFIYFQF